MSSIESERRKGIKSVFNIELMSLWLWTVDVGMLLLGCSSINMLTYWKHDVKECFFPLFECMVGVCAMRSLIITDMCFNDWDHTIGLNDFIHNSLLTYIMISSV